MKDERLTGASHHAAAPDGLAEASLFPRSEAEEASERLPAPAPDHVVAVFGGGRIAKEVAELAARVGFAVDVPHTYEEYTADSRHYVVLLTHSLEIHQALLRRMLPTSARYIGIMADERDKETLFEEMRRQGVPDAELACLRCPVGLDIGAESPMELAVAIVAELIAARAGCPLRPKR